MSRHLCAELLLALGMSLIASIAAGQDEQTKGDVVVAAETFRAGEAAYKRGDFEAAARAFEVSHRLAPHPFALYNAGLAWQAAEQRERAADAFAAALALGGLNEDQDVDARVRLDKLLETLGWVSIEAPADAVIELGHVERARAPLRVHLAPGEHELRAQLAGGKVETRKVDVVVGAESRVIIAPPPAAPPPGPAGQPTPSPETPEPGPDGVVIGGWVTLAAGVAGAGAAIGMGVAALGARDRFEDSGNTDAAARDRAATLRTATNIAWAGAGALAGTGVLLLVLGYSDDGTAAGWGLEVGPASARLIGRF